MSKRKKIFSTACPHVLLVEDMKLNRDLIVMLLEREEYEVTAVANALDALQAMAEHLFDIVLMDVRMEGMDGLTAMKIVRSCEQGHVPTEDLADNLTDNLIDQLRGKRTPTIIMTASSNAEDKNRGLNAGADEFLPKPFTPEELFFVLEKVVDAT